MNQKNLPSLYENKAFQDFSDGMLRPGGMQTTKHAIGLARVKAGEKLLDVGCGYGTTVDFLQRQGIQAVGLDSSKALLQTGGQQYPGLDLRLGTAECLPFSMGAFDVVLMECTLSVFQRQTRVLQEAKRVLRPGGKLVVSDLYHKHSGNMEQLQALPRITGGHGIHNKRYLWRLFRQQGFTFCAWKDCTSLYKGFLATAIMDFGSLSNFWQRMSGSCPGKDCTRQEDSKEKLSYYISVWQKPGNQKRRIHYAETSKGNY